MILMKNQANQFRQYFVPSIQQHYLPFSDKCPELVDLDSTEETLSKRPVDSQVLQEKEGQTQKQYRSRSEDWCNGSWRAQHCLLVGQRETRVAGDGDRLLRLSCVCALACTTAGSYYMRSCKESWQWEVSPRPS